MESIHYYDSQDPSTVSTAHNTQLLIDKLIGANYCFNKGMDFDYPIDFMHTSTTLYQYQTISPEDIEGTDSSDLTHTSTTLYHTVISPEDINPSSDSSYNPSQPPSLPSWASTPYRRLVLTLSGPRLASPLSQDVMADLIQAHTAGAYLTLHKHGALSF
jgi:hypothetical protein